MYCAGLTTTHAGEVYSTVCAVIIHYLQPTGQDYFSKSVGWEKGTELAVIITVCIHIVFLCMMILSYDGHQQL